MADFSKEVFEEFFQVFAKSVKATLDNMGSGWSQLQRHQTDAQ